MAGKSCYTDAQRAEWEARARAGEGTRQISLDLGVGYDTVNAHLKRVGLFKRNYSANSKLSDDDKEDIIRRYKAGEGATTLGRAYGVDKAAIYCMLNRAGVGTRPCSDRVKGDCVVRSACAKRKGGWGSKPANCNHLAFDVLTPEVLYWMGYLAADGNVIIPAGRLIQFSVNCQITDKSHLVLLRSFLQSDKKIRTTNDAKAGGRGTCSLTINSPQLAGRLVELGITPRKGTNVSEGLLDPQLTSSNHFWRGMWDGDGSLASCIPYLSGNKSWMGQWVTFAKEQGIPVDGPHKTPTTHVVYTPVKSMDILCSVLGYDAPGPPMLYRKYLSALTLTRPITLPSCLQDPLNILQQTDFPGSLESGDFEGIPFCYRSIAGHWFVAATEHHTYQAMRSRGIQSARCFWRRLRDHLKSSGITLRLILPGDTSNGWLSLARHLEGSSIRRKGARHYAVVNVDHRIAKAFYQDHHIQGYRRGKHLALVDSQRHAPVAMMTIGSPSDCRAWGLSAETHLLIARFAVDGHVPGAASRLLSHARQCRGHRIVLTYSDSRYSSGGLYATLGLTQSKESGPDYIYLIKDTVMAKAAGQKSKLIKMGGKGETESELANSLGLRRMYDLGKIRWSS